MNFGTDRVKPWKDIWGCGQGIGAIDEVLPAAALVARLQREYRAARERLSLDAFACSGFRTPAEGSWASPPSSRA